MRQIILDTETTGLRVEDGHRMIEIACLEMINRKLSGKFFHYYINPERDIDKEAEKIHGISNALLNDKPVFRQIEQELMDFIKGAELIIHNAPFDLGFLNYEFSLTRTDFESVTDYCAIIDTLQLARKLHAGQRNSLDALCKRYGVDNSRRDLHGALIDTDLLAQVYLLMTGGQGSFFDLPSENNHAVTRANMNTAIAQSAEQHNLMVLQASPEELLEHEKYLELLEKQG